jgi:hypothetical protein
MTKTTADDTPQPKKKPPKLDSLTLRYQASQAHANIPVGSVWKHYKGGVYQVDDVALHTETNDYCVIYHRIEGPRFDAAIEEGVAFCRPIDIWFSKTESGQDRFTRVRKVERWEDYDKKA